MILPLLLLAAAQAPAPSAQDRARAERVLERAPIIDGHNDLPWGIREHHHAAVESVDLNKDTSKIDPPLQTDLARLKRGRVGGQFWSVWIAPTTTGPQAVETTIEQIDIVRRMIGANPTRMALARDAADMARIARSGRVASLIGVEGGHQIDGRLSVLRQYYNLGVRYMTLTHTKSVGWADASTDTPQANGLTPFGRQVVHEMNRLGMLIDVAHVSDTTMAAALAESKAPVIASHSNARALADRPRNIPDDLLRAIGATRAGARRHPRRRAHATAASPSRSAAISVIEMAVPSAPDEGRAVDSTSGPRAVTTALAGRPLSSPAVGASSRRIA